MNYKHKLATAVIGYIFMCFCAYLSASTDFQCTTDSDCERIHGAEQE